MQERAKIQRRAKKKERECVWEAYLGESKAEEMEGRLKETLVQAPPPLFAADRMMKIETVGGAEDHTRRRRGKKRASLTPDPDTPQKNRNLPRDWLFMKNCSTMNARTAQCTPPA